MDIAMKPGSQNQRKQSTTKQKNRNPSKSGKVQASVAAAYASPAIGKAPIIKATRDCCNIKHRELISDVVGTSAFTVASSFNVNPGLSSTFPWLSVMAQGWEQFRFKNIRFIYKTRTGSNTAGSLMMAPDYDSADGPPATEQVASSYSQVIEDAVWKDITCVLKTSNEGIKRHFVRTGPLAQNLDIKTYDVATLHLCTNDGSDGVKWGKLWVEYDIDFFVPQLPSNGANSLAGGRITPGGTISPINPFGTAPVLDPQSVGLTIDNASKVTLAQPGDYVASFIGSGTAITGFNVSTSTGLSNLSISSTTRADGAQVSAQVLFSASAGATFTMALTATTCTGLFVVVARVPLGSTS